MFLSSPRWNSWLMAQYSNVQSRVLNHSAIQVPHTKLINVKLKICLKQDSNRRPLVSKATALLTVQNSVPCHWASINQMSHATFLLLCSQNKSMVCKTFQIKWYINQWYFLKNMPTPASFCLFQFFSNTNFSEKKLQPSAGFELGLSELKASMLTI